jgi:uncharacterized membrane protein YadS
VVKLSRVLWILPLTLAAAVLFRSRQAGAPRPKASVPWFVAGFLLASALASAVPMVARIAPSLMYLAKAGFAFTLFCIGASLSREAIRAVGYRPLLQGLLLWLFVSGTALLAVLGLDA